MFSHKKVQEDLSVTDRDTKTQTLAKITDIDKIRAQAHIHHAYFLGLQLMIATRKGPQVMGDWMFRLFRRQHEEKFLSSFDKLGLSHLPDAIACAQYHVLSNNIGGVGVEYMPDSNTKAWVRFRYPRWMYHGPTICGIPIEVSRGFLNGWYGHNGVSLKNPRLGFVCVSEDMTGEFGFCGYFKEFDYDLAENERLSFAGNETPPEYGASVQPSVPAAQWTQARLEKANRNYAMEYVRNGLCTLEEVIGEDQTKALGSLAARLIGLQYFQETKDALGGRDGDLHDAALYLTAMLEGMGDAVSINEDKASVVVIQQGLRITRDLSADQSELVFDCWKDLWVGALQSMQTRRSLTAFHQNKDHESATVRWLIT